MTATEVLREEHKAISLALRGAARESRTLQDEGTVHQDILEQILGFARNFTEACHHGKEEKHLFPMLAKAGISTESGLIGELLAEHAQGRQHMQKIAEALPRAVQGDSEASAQIASELAGYVAMLRTHIGKENSQLFPLTDQTLSSEEQAELAAAFERLEVEEIGEGLHEKYHALARELAGLQ